MIRIQVHGTITLDDTTAEMLEHLSAFGFAKEFYEKCSRRYTEGEIVDGMERLRNEIRTILRAKAVADAAASRELAVK